MLEMGQEENWFESRFIISVALVTVVALVSFVLREFLVEKPAVELRILRSASFTSATIMGGVLGLG